MCAADGGLSDPHQAAVGRYAATEKRSEVGAEKADKAATERTAKDWQKALARELLVSISMRHRRWRDGFEKFGAELR